MWKLMIVVKDVDLEAMPTSIFLNDDDDDDDFECFISFISLVALRWTPSIKLISLLRYGLHTWQQSAIVTIALSCTVCELFNVE